MRLKGIYKDKSVLFKIGLLLLILLLSFVLHLFIVQFIGGLIFENDLANIQDHDLTDSNQRVVNYLKFSQLFLGLGLFVVPILLYTYFMAIDLGFRRVTRQQITLLIVIMLLIVPFIALLREWNMSIKLPQWIDQIDAKSDLTTAAFLKMGTIADLLYNVLVIAIVPAIGEELIFRGYLQKKIVKWLRSPHLGILLTAFLFSIIHLHFKGLVPRFALGALLGYLFYWSRNLWIPIIAHFFWNTQLVIFAFTLEAGDMGSLKSNINPGMGLFSLVSVLLLLYIFYQGIDRKNS